MSDESDLALVARIMNAEFFCMTSFRNCEKDWKTDAVKLCTRRRNRRDDERKKMPTENKLNLTESPLFVRVDRNSLWFLFLLFFKRLKF